MVKCVSAYAVRFIVTSFQPGGSLQWHFGRTAAELESFGKASYHLERMFKFCWVLETRHKVNRSERVGTSVHSLDGIHESNNNAIPSPSSTAVESQRPLLNDHAVSPRVGGNAGGQPVRSGLVQNLFLQDNILMTVLLR